MMGSVDQSIGQPKYWLIATSCCRETGFSVSTSGLFWT